MYKVIITKQNQITNQAQFPTQLEAQAWLDQESQNLSFGKIQREAKEIEVTGVDGIKSIMLDNNEDIAKSISTRQELNPMTNVLETYHTLPADFTSSITDISLQVQAQKDSVEALAYLLSTDFLILRAAEGAKLCPQAVLDLRAAARLKVIK